jgi:hypothetical protein
MGYIDTSQLPLFGTGRASVLERKFGGETFDPALDTKRLTGQLHRGFEVMQDGNWHTLEALRHAIGGSEAGISARIRDLRKPQFGNHTVERRRVSSGRGLWEYKLIVTQDK